MLGQRRPPLQTRRPHPLPPPPTPRPPPPPSSKNVPPPFASWNNACPSYSTDDFIASVTSIEWTLASSYTLFSFPSVITFCSFVIVIFVSPVFAPHFFPYLSMNAGSIWS